MNLRLTGKRVLITAGAAGIGRAIAEGFAAEGARVHVCDIDAAALVKIEGFQRMTLPFATACRF